MDLHQNIQGSFFTFTYKQLQSSKRDKERKMIISPPLIKQKYSMSKKYRKKRRMVIESLKNDNRDQEILKKRLNKDFLIIYRPLKMMNHTPQKLITRDFVKLEKKREIPVWRKKKRSFNINQKMDPEKYRYKIYGGNNPSMIKRCLKTRPWWEDSENNPMMVHFFNKPYMRQRRFDILSDNKGFKQTLNHFEGQRKITDKDKMFKNMKLYLEKKKINIFEFVPLTFAMNLRDKNIEKDLLEFSQLFQAITIFHDLESKKIIFLGKEGYQMKKSEYEKLKEKYSQKAGSPKKKGKGKKRKRHSYNQESAEKLVSINIVGIKKILENWKCSIFSSLLQKIEFQNQAEINPAYQPLITKFTNYYVDDALDQGKNIWLIKATALCRGFGIELFDSLGDLKQILKKFYEGYKVIDKGHGDREEFQRRLRPRVFVIQKYIEKPLLVTKKKFDIRTFVLVNQELKIFLFTEGYVKLSSEDFHLNLKKDDKYDKCVHLTNLAVQEHGEHYDELIKYNNFSFLEFEKRLKKDGIILNFRDQIWNQIREITRVSMMASSEFLNPREKKYCFEIFGYDLMIDSNFKVWLIEINTNPGFCTAESPFLEQLFHRLMDDAFKVTLDKIYPPKIKKEVQKNIKNPPKYFSSEKKPRNHHQKFSFKQETIKNLRNSDINIQNYSPSVQNNFQRKQGLIQSAISNLRRSDSTQSQKIRKIASELKKDYQVKGSTVITKIIPEIEEILKNKKKKSSSPVRLKNNLIEKKPKAFRLSKIGSKRLINYEKNGLRERLKQADNYKSSQTIESERKSKRNQLNIQKPSTSCTPHRKDKNGIYHKKWDLSWLKYDEEEDPEANHGNMFDSFKYQKYRKNSQFPLTKYPLNANLWEFIDKIEGKKYYKQ